MALQKNFILPKETFDKDPYICFPATHFHILKTYVEWFPYPGKG